jgi:hypothetical protein
MMGSVRFHPPPSEVEVMAIVHVGIDLAKNVVAVHSVDEPASLHWCALPCRAPSCTS